VKIGFIIYGSLDTLSGGFLYDRMNIDYLRRRGDQVIMFPLPFGSYSRNLADNFSVSLLATLAESPLDVLIEDELNHPSFFLLNRWLKRRAGYPVLSLVHHLRSSEPASRPLNAFYRQIERLYLQTIDGFIVNSATTLRSVEMLLGATRPSVIAHPGHDHLSAGIDRNAVSERCRQPGPLRILFLGNVIPRKGLHTLLAALADIAGEGWRLTVAGSTGVDPSYTRFIRQQAERIGPGRVTVLGTVSQDELVRLLTESHCLAVPSFYEGYGIVFMEAMGFGLPVIAAHCGAVPEIVTDGREGVLVEPGDVASLSSVIERLIRDRRLLETMSLSALTRHQRFPTWSDCGSAIRRFLTEFHLSSGRQP